MIIALKNHMPKLSCKLNDERWRQSSDFECFVVNNKYTAVTNGFKLCTLISVHTHMRDRNLMIVSNVRCVSCTIN